MDVASIVKVEGRAEAGWFVPEKTGVAHVDRVIASIKRRLGSLKPVASLYASLTGEAALGLRLGFKSTAAVFVPEWVNAYFSLDAKLVGGILIGLDPESPFFKFEFDVLPIFFPSGWKLPYRKVLA